jgi:hypothetical protein
LCGVKSLMLFYPASMFSGLTVPSPSLLTSSPADVMSSPTPRPEHGIIDIEHTINSSPTSIPNSLPEHGDTDVVNNGDKDEDEDEESDSTEEDENSVRQPEPTAEEKAEQLERFVNKERAEYERDDDGSTDEEEDSDDSDDSDEDSDDDEEEQQPLFKYKRIEGSVPTVLARRESASALTIANKHIVRPLTPPDLMLTDTPPRRH